MNATMIADQLAAPKRESVWTVTAFRSASATSATPTNSGRLTSARRICTLTQAGLQPRLIQLITDTIEQDAPIPRKPKTVVDHIMSGDYKKYLEGP